MSDDSTESAAESLAAMLGESAGGAASGASAESGTTLEDLAGQFLPQPRDFDAENRQQAESRKQAMADGADELTAQLMYPDIDPENPDRIN